MFRIIVNCGPAEQYISRCLASLRSQTHGDWRAYVTVDPCGDRTYEAATSAASGDARISIYLNQTRQYSMVNLIRAIERSEAAPDDVIVVLDGDDWFATPDALRIVADTYRNSGCWMTYGSWVSDPPDLEEERSGRWPAYGVNTIDFRSAPWLGTAPRTWKRWLWDLIDDRDFRDAEGRYLRVTEDMASMLPMLEMSGTARARHIAEVLMVYNRTSPYACGLTCPEEMFANARYLRSRPPYSRLEVRPVSDSPSVHSALSTQQCCIS